MNQNQALMFTLVLAAIWLGFILAISFMESWLKFRAKGVTLPIGLAIGNLVFKALNRVEWVLLVCILLLVFFSRSYFSETAQITLVVTGLLLLVQTLLFLPRLRKRAVRTIEGLQNPPSRVHLYYILAELIKTFCIAVLIALLLLYR